MLAEHRMTASFIHSLRAAKARRKPRSIASGNPATARIRLAISCRMQMATFMAPLITAGYLGLEPFLSSAPRLPAVAPPEATLVMAGAKPYSITLSPGLTEPIRQVE